MWGECKYCGTIRRIDVREEEVHYEPCITIMKLQVKNEYPILIQDPTIWIDRCMRCKRVYDVLDTDRRHNSSVWCDKCCDEGPKVGELDRAMMAEEPAEPTEAWAAAVDGTEGTPWGRGYTAALLLVCVVLTLVVRWSM